MPLQSLASEMMADAIIGGTAFDKFNNANSRIGVGDSTTAHNPSQQDLVAVSNKLRKTVDSGYPVRNGSELEFQATFDENEANFSWQERGLFNAASGGEMLCRIVGDLGSKTNAHVWVYTLKVTLTAS